MEYVARCDGFGRTTDQDVFCVRDRLRMGGKGQLDPAVILGLMKGYFYPFNLTFSLSLSQDSYIESYSAKIFKDNKLTKGHLSELVAPKDIL